MSARTNMQGAKSNGVAGPTTRSTLTSVAFLAGVQALGILTTPGPKRAYFDEIFTNEASELRPYSYLAGTNRVIPNLSWYGDLATKNVRNGDLIEQIAIAMGVNGLAGYIEGGGTFGIGAAPDPPSAMIGLVAGAGTGGMLAGLGGLRTTSFKYYAGWFYTIGINRIDAVTEILVDETIVGTGTTNNAGGTIFVDMPDVWGGDHVDGGVRVLCDIIPGDLWPTQLPNAYLQSVIGQVPAFSGKSGIVFRGPTGNEIDGDESGLFAAAAGGAPRVRPISLTVLALPNNLGVPEYKAINGGKDANVIEVIYDVMTGRTRNRGYGGRVPIGEINLDNFRANAATIFNEGLGYSAEIRDNISTKAVLEDLCSFASAGIFKSRSEGIKVKLIRRDYSIPTLPVFNESNIERVEGYAPGTHRDAPNEIRFEYFDRDNNFKPRPVIAQNDASQRLLNEVIPRSITYPGVGCKETAAIVTARELASSFPRPPVKLIVNSDADDIEFGDPVVWQYDKYKVDQKVLRVVGITPSDTDSNKTELTCAEDVFGRGDVTAAAPAASGWVRPSGAGPGGFSFDITRINIPMIVINGQGTVADRAGDGAIVPPMIEIAGEGSVSDGGTGPGGAYGHFRSVTVDHTKVPNTDQTDFPLLFSGTFAYLATVANAGDVENANGFDIIFTSDAAGLTQLDHEIDSYNASTGAVNFWVRIPTLTTASDFVFYIHYGNSSISTSQENAAGVWASSFALVAHMPDGTTLDASDSTSNNATPTIEPLVTAGAGLIDGAASFPGSGAGHDLRYPDSAALSPTAAITVSLWFKRSANGATRTLLCKGDGSTNAASSYEYIFNTSNQLRFEINNGSGWRTAQYSTAITDTNWHLAHGTFDGSNVKIYTDGVLRTTTAFSGLINDSAEAVRLGELNTGLNKYAGLIDEVRIASVARSADWITTEFNNQSSPGTFYSVSGEL